MRAKTFGFDVTRQVAPVMEQWKLYHADKTRILPGPAPGQRWAAPGAEVEVTGLVNRPELNGVRGRVVRHIPGKDRWEVELNGGHGKATVKAENMRIM